jgi:galactose mutarotase-like enzyme
MSLSQQSAPYVHWEYIHPETGDRLRIVPERGGIVTEWRCGDREVLYFDQERYADPTKSIRGGIPVLFPICGNLPGDVLPVNGVEHTRAPALPIPSPSWWRWRSARWPRRWRFTRRS